MKNETKNSELFREHLRNEKYYGNNMIQVEEQKSDKKQVQGLLKESAKNGSNNIGYPDFIILKKNSNLVIICECKASNQNHGDVNLANGFDYTNYSDISKKAENGVIHYMNAIKNRYNVIGIASSGETENTFRLSIFKQRQGSTTIERLNIPVLKNFETFEKLFREDTNYNLKDDNSIKKLSVSLNEYMFKEINLAEHKRPILITAIILALSDDAFKKGYMNFKTAKKTLDAMFNAVERVLEDAGYADMRILSAFKNITNVDLESGNVDPYDPYSTHITYLIYTISNAIMPFIKEDHALDIIGVFYSTFLSYVNGDRGSLGIVLTPHHITELMTRLIDLTVESRVIDPCAGSGGFLISAIDYMKSLTDDDDIKQKIKNNSCMGIELEPDMFLLLIANMLTRRNFDMNLINGSCFSEDVISKIKAFKPTHALQNPPYSKPDKEIKFISNTMDLLEKGDYGAFIVPKSTMFKMDSEHMIWRKKLLENHKLVAVMSMNDQLFYPTSTVTCICIFKAWEPHLRKDGTIVEKTWFADWQDDGFKINRGRKETPRWKNEIESKWIHDYQNKTVIDGYSAFEKVGLTDE